MTSFTIEQKRVDIFPCTEPDRPVIYLNTYGREGNRCSSICRKRAVRRSRW